MADRNTQIKGSQIVDEFAGSGMRKGSDENLFIGVDGSTIQLDVGNDWIEVPNGGITETQLNSSVAGNGLAGGGGSTLSINVDDSTIEISTDTLQVKDGGITEAKLDVLDTPSDGEYLTWNSSSSQFEWKSLSTDVVQNSDIAMEDESANCDGSKVVFDLDNDPVANSVQVFLNGLLQQKGTGLDYVLSGATSGAIQFSSAPDADDLLVIHYVEAN